MRAEGLQKQWDVCPGRAVSVWLGGGARERIQVGRAQEQAWSGDGTWALLCGGERGSAGQSRAPMCRRCGR